MSVRELFPILRALAIQSEVVGVEVVEINPLVDPTYRTEQVAVRTAREILTGIALRRRGVTDVNYVDPLWSGKTRCRSGDLA